MVISYSSTFEYFPSSSPLMHKWRKEGKKVWWKTQSNDHRVVTRGQKVQEASKAKINIIFWGKKIQIECFIFGTYLPNTRPIFSIHSKINLVFFLLYRKMQKSIWILRHVWSMELLCQRVWWRLEFVGCMILQIFCKVYNWFKKFKFKKQVE